MEILDRFKEIVQSKESSIVLEFGACDGYHSNKMLEILRKRSRPYIFHSFEPNPDLYQTAYNNMKHYMAINAGNVKLYKEAIGDVNGNAEFYKSGGKYYGSSSIRKPKQVLNSWKDMTFQKGTVDVITLDAHAQRSGLTGKVIDFIWADIQGAEVDLINGGKETLKNVRYLYTEYENSELYEGEINRDQIMEMLPYFELIEDYGGDILLKNKNHA